MTLEQKIRNAGETGVIGIEYDMTDLSKVKVLNDYEGVLEVEQIGWTGEAWASLGTTFLNGDKFFETHEEAYAAEL